MKLLLKNIYEDIYVVTKKENVLCGSYVSNLNN